MSIGPLPSTQAFNALDHQRIATGPDLSRTSAAPSDLGNQAIIDNMIDPVQVGIYFIALRMKRETMDENRACSTRYWKPPAASRRSRR